MNTDQIRVNCKKHGERRPAQIVTVDDRPYIVVCFMCWADKEYQGLQNYAHALNSVNDNAMAFEEAKAPEGAEAGEAPKGDSEASAEAPAADAAPKGDAPAAK